MADVDHELTAIRFVVVRLQFWSIFQSTKYKIVQNFIISWTLFRIKRHDGKKLFSIFSSNKRKMHLNQLNEPTILRIGTQMYFALNNWWFYVITSRNFMHSWGEMHRKIIGIFYVHKLFRIESVDFSADTKKKMRA